MAQASLLQSAGGRSSIWSGSMILPDSRLQAGRSAKVPERVSYQDNDNDVRYQFAQQLQLLGSQLSIEPAYSCYVPARMAQTSDETNENGVGTTREDDRDCCGCSFGRQGRIIASDCSEHGHLPSYEICREIRK